MQRFEDLLAHWSATELSDDLGIGKHTAASIKRRGSVSPEHWPALIQAAENKGITLDEATLLRLWLIRKAEPDCAA